MVARICLLIVAALLCLSGLSEGAHILKVSKRQAVPPYNPYGQPGWGGYGGGFPSACQSNCLQPYSQCCQQTGSPTQCASNFAGPCRSSCLGGGAGVASPYQGTSFQGNYGSGYPVYGQQYSGYPQRYPQGNLQGYQQGYGVYQQQQQQRTLPPYPQRYG